MRLKERQEASIIKKATRYQLYGWLLFIVCAILFIVASIISWQPMMLAGSIIFLFACILFVIPLLGGLGDGINRGDG